MMSISSDISSVAGDSNDYLNFTIDEDFDEEGAPSSKLVRVFRIVAKSLLIIILAFSVT